LYAGYRRVWVGGGFAIRVVTIGAFMLFVFDLIHVVHSPRISSAWHSIFSNSSKDHALLQTFLKTTKLASISLSLIYFTVTIRYTTVHPFVLDSSLEKAFASFTSYYAVM
jgi:hypothetical protein